MLARDVMSEGVMSVSADATVFETAKLLVNAQVSALPVVDEAGDMIGIVSEADVIQRAAADASPGSLLGHLAEDVASAGAYGRTNSWRVTDVMTRPVMCVDEDTPLSEIARLMLDTGIKRVPVRRGRAVVGMVSRMDLVRALISQLTPPAAAHPESGVAEPADATLRREIEDAVRGRSWSLAQLSDVVVRDGVAHLWGIVPSDMVRQAYRIAAENVPGVKEVQSHMHVVPPSPMRLGL
jgi:CBS domain-containing protein